MSMGNSDALWKEASEEETEKIIEKVARETVDRELDFPATFLINCFRPVSFIGGQLARVFLAPFTPLISDFPYAYIPVFEKNENLKRLLRRIKELTEEREENKRKLKEKDIATK